MLKRALIVALALMFVVGLSGIANAFCFGCRGPDCEFDVEIDYDLDVDLHAYWEEMVGDNIEAICQDGNGNLVYNTDQLNGSNLLLVYQDGNGNTAGVILQDNTSPPEGMNVLTVRQDGNNNVATDIYQYNAY